MKKYFSIFRCSLQVVIAYRSTYFTNILSSLLYIVFLFSLWSVIFKENQIVGGFTWDQMKIYILVTYIINAEVFSEFRFSSKIKNGSVAMDLIKPLHFQYTSLAETMGLVVLSTVVNCCIAFMFVMVVGVNIEYSGTSIFFFTLSIIFGLLLRFFIVFLNALSSFWTENVTGVMWVRIAITNMLSGALIPVAFFPDWLVKVNSFLPFHAIVSLPAKIIMNELSVWGGASLVIVQIYWVLVLIVLINIVMKHALRKLSVNGG